MAYRKTRRSREQLARMKAGKDAARMARPAPERAPDLPELRRRIVITDYDFGERVHTFDLYRTNRVDCGIIAEAKDECESSLLPNQSAIGVLHGYVKYYRRTSSFAHPLRTRNRFIHANCPQLCTERTPQREKQVGANSAQAKCCWIHSVFGKQQELLSTQAGVVVYDRRVAGRCDRSHQRKSHGQQVDEPSSIRRDAESAKSTQSKGWQHRQSSWCVSGKREREVHRSNYAQLQTHPSWQVRHGGRSTCRVPWRKTRDTQGLYNLGVHVDGKPWKARIGWSKILEGLRKSLPRVAAL